MNNGNAKTINSTFTIYPSTIEMTNTATAIPSTNAPHSDLKVNAIDALVDLVAWGGVKRDCKAYSRIFFTTPHFFVQLLLSIVCLILLERDSRFRVLFLSTEASPPFFTLPYSFFFGIFRLLFPLLSSLLATIFVRVCPELSAF